MFGCGQTIEEVVVGDASSGETESTKEENPGESFEEESETVENSDDVSGGVDVAQQDPDSEEEVQEEDSEVLFGFWGLNGYVSADGLADVASRYGATVFQTASAAPGYTVNTLLPLVRSAGMKVTLRMSGGHSDYTTSGNFDLDKWKEKIAVWEDSGVQEFIDDGTLAGHMILDDIRNFANYDPVAADLDEMARYSQEIMPGLLTFVRQQATNMPTPDGGQYTYVDAVVNQYKASEGDVNEYAANQADKAAELGVAIINGLNICDGGDGSSGQVGWRADKFAMTAEEIAEYGEVLINVEGILMFLMWEYDSIEEWSDGSIGSDYFDQDDFVSAFFGLSQIVSD